MNPVYAHRMSFLVRDPTTDVLKISVIDDIRGQVLGTLRVNMTELLDRASLSLPNHRFELHTRLRRAGFAEDFKDEATANINLSLALRFIHRPNTVSFGVHNNLAELQKIMTGSVNNLKENKHGSTNNLKDNKQALKSPSLVMSGDQQNQKVNGVHHDLEESSRKLNNMFQELKEEKEEISMNSGSTLPLKQQHNPSSQSPRYIDDTSDVETRRGTFPGKAEPEMDEPRTPPLSSLEPALQFVEHSQTLPNPQKSQQKNPQQKLQRVQSQSEEKLKKDDDESVQKIPTKNNLRPNDPKVQLSLKYSLRTMTLTVVVHRARNLQETPHSLLPNPYVKFYLLESIGVSHNIRRANSKRKTKIKKNSVNPLFEETLIYYLMPDEMRSSRLEVILGSDHGILGRNEVLGKLKFFDASVLWILKAPFFLGCIDLFRNLK